MSADPSEYLRLLLTNQQQQQQQQQQQGDSLNPQQLLQQFGVFSANSASQQQGPLSTSALSNFLANYHQTASGTSNGGLSLPLSSAQDNGSAQQQREYLLQSAKLLSTVAPGLAAAALEQALTLVSSEMSQPTQAQNSLQQRGTTLPSHEELLRALMSLSQSNAAAVQSTDNNERQVSTLSIQSNSCTPRSSDAAQSNTNESMINRGAKGRSTSTSLPTRMPAPSYQTNQTAAASASGLGCAPARQSQIGALSAPLPPEPVSILTLQTWSREQLESHVKKLKECNLPIPNAVIIVLEDMKQKEEKKHAKRIANRKSANSSRARKKELIDALTAAHAKLRRQALILSYLPDPIVVIDTGGKIKFCSTQMERVTKYKVDELLGSSIEEIIVPDSRDAIRQLIKDLVNAEQRAIAVSQQDGMNVDGEDEVRTGEIVLESSEDPTSKNDNKPSRKKCPTAMSFTQNESSLTSESSPSEDNNECLILQTHIGSVVDDVMGSSVTANNADARLSSLMHYPKNEAKEAAISSLSADSSTPMARNSSDSGDSNESSDDFEQGSSSSISSKKKGKELCPLAPSANVCLIRNDLTTIWCEITSSIRTRPINDEDSELGIIDPNPKSYSKALHKEEKELLLCFRPILEGSHHVDEELSLQGKRKKPDNKDTDNLDNTSTGTETDCAIMNRPIKKRSSSRTRGERSICSNQERI